MPVLDTPFDMMRRSKRLSKELAVRYAKVPGIHVHVREERCTGCGSCVRKGYCHFGAISIEGNKAKIDDRRCRGCGRCTHLCPRNALLLELRPPEAVKEAVRMIDRKVDRLLR